MVDYLRSVVHIKAMSPTIVDFDFYNDSEPFNLVSKIETSKLKFYMGTLLPYIGT